MNKKKAGKSKIAKSTRNLPAKTVNAKAAKTVKGGATKSGQPTESVSFGFGKIQY